MHAAHAYPQNGNRKIDNKVPCFAIYLGLTVPYLCTNKKGEYHEKALDQWIAPHHRNGQ